MAILRRPYLFAAWNTPLADPESWTAEQHRALVALHLRWRITRDLLAPAEVRRLAWLRYMVAAGKVGRG